jgi:hypothetical protein
MTLGCPAYVIKSTVSVSQCEEFGTKIAAVSSGAVAN